MWSMPQPETFLVLFSIQIFLNYCRWKSNKVLRLPRAKCFLWSYSFYNSTLSPKKKTYLKSAHTASLHHYPKKSIWQVVEWEGERQSAIEQLSSCSSFYSSASHSGFPSFPRKKSTDASLCSSRSGFDVITRAFFMKCFIAFNVLCSSLNLIGRGAFNEGWTWTDLSFLIDSFGSQEKFWCNKEKFWIRNKFLCENFNRKTSFAVIGSNDEL